MSKPQDLPPMICGACRAEFNGPNAAEEISIHMATEHYERVEVERDSPATSDRANTSPRASWHISGTNTDTWLDDIYKNHDLDVPVGYHMDNMRNCDFCRQALTTKMEQVELDARKDEAELAFGNMSTPDPLKTQTLRMAELQAHHKQEEKK